MPGAYKSFGASHLAQPHAKVDRGRLKITYTGKHGIKRTVTITDRNLMRIAKRTQDLPGQHLFEYVDESGRCLSGDLVRRQRLHQGRDGRGLHRQGLPHLGAQA
jgi:DNA topoisomerase IB